MNLKTWGSKFVSFQCSILSHSGEPLDNFVLATILSAKVWRLPNTKVGYKFISLVTMLLNETGENKSFAVGHFAFGYTFSKFTSRTTKTKLNIPLVFTLSVIPDIDILIPFVQHRGPFHSIIMIVAIFILIFALYGKKAFPYFIALIQHPLIGDFIAGGGVQLLWPLTSQHYGMGISIKSPTNITLEWLGFLAATIVMVKTKDTQTLLQPHNSNLILAIPTFTVLLPTFLAFPLDVPIALIPPHLICLILFLTSLLIDMRKIGCQALSKRGEKVCRKNLKERVQ
ncbi:MAG: metal-dependent hydrolase [Fervidobacterium sp.]